MLRSAILWLEQVMNSGLAQGETGAMKGASLILGVPQEPSSHEPKVLNIKSALSYVLKHVDAEALRPNFGHAAGDDLGSSRDAEADIGDGDSKEDVEEGDEEDDGLFGAQGFDQVCKPCLAYSELVLHAPRNAGLGCCPW